MDDSDTPLTSVETFRTCANCLFFKKHPNSFTKGECVSMSPRGKSRWPRVASTDWCGMWSYANPRASTPLAIRFRREKQFLEQTRGEAIAQQLRAEREAARDPQHEDQAAKERDRVFAAQQRLVAKLSMPDHLKQIAEAAAADFKAQIEAKLRGLEK